MQDLISNNAAKPGIQFKQFKIKLNKLLVHLSYILQIQYMYMYMNQKYSKLSIEEKPQNKARHGSFQNRESHNLSIDYKYLENINPWHIDYTKSNDKIKNFITFLKLIDERIN